MGRDELPVWWYDFHNLIFLLYNDKILLFLLMGGRRKIKLWDPSILRNDRVQKVAEKFGSFRGGSGIQEFYSVTLTRLEILLKKVASEKWLWSEWCSKNIVEKFATLCGASAWGQENLGGEDCHVPSNWPLKVLTMLSSWGLKLLLIIPPRINFY